MHVCAFSLDLGYLSLGAGLFVVRGEVQKELKVDLVAVNLKLWQRFMNICHRVYCSVVVELPSPFQVLSVDRAQSKLSHPLFKCNSVAPKNILVRVKSQESKSKSPIKPPS